MQCKVNKSVYKFINGRIADINSANDCNNGLLEILVDGARYVVAKNEVIVLPDLAVGVSVNDLPY